MPEITTTAPAATARPATLAEFLERYPLPWRPYRIDSLSGAEWEIEAANGQLVPNHGATFCLEEYAKVFAELGNEVGRLREVERAIDVAHAHLLLAMDSPRGIVPGQVAEAKRILEPIAHGFLLRRVAARRALAAPAEREPDAWMVEVLFDDGWHSGRTYEKREHAMRVATGWGHRSARVVPLYRAPIPPAPERQEVQDG